MNPSTKKVLITGAAGVALLASSAVPALALAHGGDRRPVVSGTVSAKSGTTLTVSANGTNYSVETADARLLGSSTTPPTAIALSDIAVGDAISIVGPVSGTTITARVIFEGPVPAKAKLHDGLNGRVLIGTLSSVGSTTLTVMPRTTASTTAPVTVLTTASTTVMMDGRRVALSDLAAGQSILVSGTVNPNGTIAATKLMVRTVGSFERFSGHDKGNGKGHDKGRGRGHDNDD